MAMVFDDSIGLYILFVEFFLKIDIFMAVLLIFVDNFLGMVKIVLKFFILVFELLDSIEHFFIAQLEGS